ncbi:MAG: hypothetical protein U5Q44_05725 [Dehalococcoidia bacterium]|nr:hypothetical protein [Dehalococcoidia bacterium]
MGIDSPALVVLHGGDGEGPAERTMAHARAAAARISIRAAREAGFETVIVATDSPGAFADVTGVIVDPDAEGEPFELHRRLREVVGRFGLERPAVMGAGAVPLLGVGEFQFVVEQLRLHDERFVTNNFFSGDITGWTPGRALERLGKFERDNQIPRRLRDEGELVPVILPRTTGTQFDLDTPADLCVLAFHEGLDPELRAAMQGLELPLQSYYEVMQVFCDRKAELIVAGRVGSQAWHHLERETACRVRLISEERGMAAADDGHRPRSIAGFMIEDVGPERFFARMAEMGDALVLDTRVVEAHLGLEPTREDRFQSDLATGATRPGPGAARDHGRCGGGAIAGAAGRAFARVRWADGAERCGVAGERPAAGVATLRRSCWSGWLSRRCGHRWVSA